MLKEERDKHKLLFPSLELRDSDQEKQSTLRQQRPYTFGHVADALQIFLKSQMSSQLKLDVVDLETL